MKKLKYTKEDYLELKSWFEKNNHLLQGGMQIDVSTYTPDVRKTVSMLLEQVSEYYGNDKMYGGYLLLTKIKQLLEVKNK